MMRSETMSSEETASSPSSTPPPPAEAPRPAESAAADSSEDESPNRSRELKSLLALSKEANLDTNIAHKRKEKAASRPSSAKCFPVTAEHELEDGEEGGQQQRQRPASESPWKRPRLDSGGSHESAGGDKAKALATPKLFKENKDMFCWRCHRDGVNIACETCPRSYHGRCLKQSIPDAEKWLCPECASIMTSESTHNRTLKDVPLGHLCNLLKFALNRMMQCHGSQPFLHPVNEADFPEYRRYIVYPMDLTKIEKNIKSNLYGSTQAFEADSKWLLHNSIIFNSYQSKLTSVAKNIVKVCRQEMAEIENCSNCYLNANTKKDTWFVEVCPKPHLPVWAKLKGFPYWPAKVLSVTGAGMVDVRFFGAHDRAWIPHRDCYLFSEKDPNTFKQKRQDIEECIDELRLYVDNLRRIYGEFRYAPYKVAYDPTDYELQLKMFLPRYENKVKKGKEEKEEEEEENEEEEEESGTDEGEKTDATMEEEEKADGVEEQDTKKSDSEDEVDDKKEETTNHDEVKKSDNEEEKEEVKKSNGDPKDSPEKEESPPVDESKMEEKEEEGRKDLQVDERVENEKEIDVEQVDEREDEEEEEDEDTQTPTDASVEKEALRGAPRMRGGIHASSGRVKVLPRRRSEPAARSPADKEKDERSSTSDDSARRPEPQAAKVVRVSIDGNAEVSISPRSKMSERLMSRLKAGEGEEKKEKEKEEELRNDSKNLFSIIHSSLESTKEDAADREGERPAKKRRPSSSDGSRKPVPLPLVIPRDEIKSEPESSGDEEEDEAEGEEDEEDEEDEEEEESHDSDLEAKKRYLSALNISERSLAEAATALKRKPEIRTRAKAEERRERFKVVDNMTKVIDEVAVNYNHPSRRHVAPVDKDPAPSDGGGEIQVKSFAKLKTPENHQRARKSFPTPTYGVAKGVATPPPPQKKLKIAVTMNGTVGGTAQTRPKVAQAPAKPVEGPSTTTTTTMQHVILVPAPSVGYATTVANQAVAVMPKVQQPPPAPMPPLTPSVGTAPSTSVLKISQFVPNTKASQNYIPQQDDVILVSSAPGAAPAPAPPPPPKAKPSAPSPSSARPQPESQQNDDEFSIIRGLVPDNVNRALTELLVRPPPKLKPRPPGMLGERFDQGTPSSAGEVAAKVNAIAHRMTDYFRGMLIETLEEFGKESNPESRIARLQLELETMRHKHNAELSEIRRTVCSILKDVQDSIALEKEKAVEEARAACEAETIRRVELAKSKQWCTMCSKEAQFYCCWNTSYCDYPCQQKHWPQHMGKCTQNTEKTTGGTTTASAVLSTATATTTTMMATVPLVRASQPLVLRPAMPPKNAVGRILAKPTRIYMNKSLGPPTAKSYKTFTSGNSHITVIETSTGSYELFSSNGLIAGKTMTAPKIMSPTTSGGGGGATVAENNGSKV